jgi:PPK2 family polyphosphate:nucleotide phosphotransferase
MDQRYKYDGSRKLKLSEISTDETDLCRDRREAEEKLDENNRKIDELQQKLYADKREGVIFLFQAMDAAGKDGTIRAVLQCLSPHGVNEVAFKSPSSNELAHDYLWRVELHVPAKGEIAIFNRSHYEEVLIYRVKKLWKQQKNARRIDTDKIMEHRYEDIRNYEAYLYHNNVRTVKIFLNVSKKEQAKRFLSRIETPEKNWKFSAADYEERRYWDEYQAAFEDAINETATKHAPWYVVPADHKWYMRYVVSEIILENLEEMDPHYPEVTEDRLSRFGEIREELEGELGITESDDPDKNGNNKKSRKNGKKKK